MNTYFDGGTGRVETIAEPAAKTEAKPTMTMSVATTGPDAAKARTGMEVLQLGRRAKLLEGIPSINE